MSKILIINGSPRAGGNTAFLVNALLKGVTFTKKEFNVCNSVIEPCLNCEACLGTGKCFICDDADKLFDAAKAADYVIIASPVIFGSLPGYIIDLMSRFQCLFTGGDFKKLPAIGNKKQGCIIITAGGSGSVDGALKSAKILAKMLNVENPVVITTLQTDKVPAREDSVAINQINELRQGFN